MTTFKIWFWAGVSATMLMMFCNAAKAAPTVEELCTWGEWAAAQNIELKPLVKALNEVDGMPNEDKLILIKCYVEVKEIK